MYVCLHVCACMYICVSTHVGGTYSHVRFQSHVQQRAATGLANAISFLPDPPMVIRGLPPEAAQHPAHPQAKDGLQERKPSRRVLQNAVLFLYKPQLQPPDCGFPHQPKSALAKSTCRNPRPTLQPSPEGAEVVGVTVLKEILGGPLLCPLMIQP